MLLKPSEHPLIAAASQAANDILATITRNEKVAIHFFNYVRFFDDGTSYLLCNNSNVIDYIYDTNSSLIAPIPLNLIQEKFKYVIPTSGPYQKVMHDARSYFNIANCIDLFDVKEGYVDVCCFGSTPGNDEIINFYINNTNTLQNYLNQFKEKASDLIATFNKNRIELPSKLRLNFKSDAVPKPEKNLTALTKRQIECLTYLLKGYKIKEIGHTLALSPRTVEHYIEAAKSNLNCDSRADLILKAHSLFSEN